MLGLEPGGVCPFVDADADATVLVDRGVLDRERVSCGSGRDDATPVLTSADLIAASGGSVVDVAADGG